MRTRLANPNETLAASDSKALIHRLKSIEPLDLRKDIWLRQTQP